MVTSEVPPALKNGSVTPITGKTAKFMPRLTTVWLANIIKTPMQMDFPIQSVETRDTIKILMHSALINTMTSKQPKKPIASPMKEKIKSF